MQPDQSPPADPTAPLEAAAQERKPLALHFALKGDGFFQLIREGRAAIYSRFTPGTRREQFEVIVIQGHDGREVHGTWYDPAEYFPSTSAWGSLAWTCTTRADADPRFDALCIRFGTRRAGPARRRTPSNPQP